MIEALKANGAFFINDAETKQKLRDAIFPEGVMNKNLVGQSVAKIAETAGIDVPADTQVIIVEADGCGKADLFCKEKMCPVIATFKYNGIEDALRIAQANLDVEGRGHSVSFHTNSKEHAEFIGEHATVCRVLINQICSTCNGGAFSNGLSPTTTLGCGSWGNNSISENLNYRCFLNITRVAYNNGKAQPSDEEIWG